MKAPLILYLTGFTLFLIGGLVMQFTPGSIPFLFTVLLGLGLQVSAVFIYLKRDMTANKSKASTG